MTFVTLRWYGGTFTAVDTHISVWNTRSSNNQGSSWSNYYFDGSGIYTVSGNTLTFSNFYFADSYWESIFNGDWTK